MNKIAIIGGGAAGMLAAITAAKNGAQVHIFEKNNKLGKKIYITGKGRCNLTNTADLQGFMDNIPGNPYFLYSAFYNFSNEDTINFFESLGLKTKQERGGRVFPVSDKAEDVVKTLENELNRLRVKIHLSCTVKDLIIKDGEIKGIVEESGKDFLCDAVIVATGGLSYPLTGSTGDGYRFALSAGHEITKLYPSLVPFTVKEQWCKELQGLSLKNIEIKLQKNNKTIYKDFGELMFTHYGVSGPVILSASRSILDIKDNVTLYIDLKPALDEKTLDNRIIRDFEKNKNKEFKNSLDDLLPQKLIPVIIRLCNIKPEKKVNEITKEERKQLCNIVKNMELTITGNRGYNEAVITSGGILISQLDPMTMESKLVKNLFFSGEVIDVDAFTGGFNLQIAFSTGFSAGLGASKKTSFGENNEK